jgi:hypothetical protein
MNSNGAVIALREADNSRGLPEGVSNNLSGSEQSLQSNICGRVNASTIPLIIDIVFESIRQNQRFRCWKNETEFDEEVLFEQRRRRREKGAALASYPAASSLFSRILVHDRDRKTGPFSKDPS